MISLAIRTDLVFIKKMVKTHGHIYYKNLLTCTRIKLVFKVK